MDLERRTGSVAAERAPAAVHTGVEAGRAEDLVPDDVRHRIAVDEDLRLERGRGRSGDILHFLPCLASVRAAPAVHLEIAGGAVLPGNDDVLAVAVGGDGAPSGRVVVGLAISRAYHLRIGPSSATIRAAPVDELEAPGLGLTGQDHVHCVIAINRDAALIAPTEPCSCPSDTAVGALVHVQACWLFEARPVAPEAVDGACGVDGGMERPAPVARANDKVRSTPAFTMVGADQVVVLIGRAARQGRVAPIVEVALVLPKNVHTIERIDLDLRPGSVFRGVGDLDWRGPADTAVHALREIQLVDVGAGGHELDDGVKHARGVDGDIRIAGPAVLRSERDRLRPG